MPMYMGIHEIRGATAADVAKAHSADVETQRKYGVEYHKYWFNATRVFKPQGVERRGIGRIYEALSRAHLL